MYTGCIQLTCDVVLALLMLSDKYNVAALSEACSRYMCTNLVSRYGYKKCLSWLQYAHTSSHHVLTKSCQEFAIWNFSAVSYF